LKPVLEVGRAQLDVWSAIQMLARGTPTTGMRFQLRAIAEVVDLSVESVNERLQRFRRDGLVVGSGDWVKVTQRGIWTNVVLSRTAQAELDSQSLTRVFRRRVAA
jgi:hypothetical protein